MDFGKLQLKSKILRNTVLGKISLMHLKKNFKPPHYEKPNNKKLSYLVIEQRKKIRYLDYENFLQLTVRLTGLGTG